MSEQYGTFLIFDDIKSNEYGVWISGTGTYNAPNRDVEFITIPGRSGDLLIENGRYENLEIIYPAFISHGFDTRFDDFKAAMLSKSGYKRLEDTYHPEEYRLAVFRSAMEPKTGPYNKAGSFEIVFNCKPQRFLKIGEIETVLTGNGTLSNPTQYTARPLIRVYGYGVLGVGSDTVTIASHSYPYIDLDCEAMDARYGAANCNSLITLTGDSFPALNEGETGVTMSGNITKVSIAPRWWRI